MSKFTKLAYHIVFSTKYRQPVIHSSLQTRLYDYIGGIIREKKTIFLKLVELKTTFIY